MPARRRPQKPKRQAPRAARRHPRRPVVNRRSRPIRRAPRNARASGFSGRHVGNSSMLLRNSQTRNRISASSGRMGDRLRISGSEFIASVVVPTGGDVSEGILYQRYNGAAPPNTRLAQFAGIFERWHPIRYTYRFIPSRNVTTNGTYVFAQEADPTRVFTSGVAGNTASLRVIPGSSMVQYFQPSSASLPASRDYTSLWCVDPDAGSPVSSDRLDLAGQLVMVTASPGGLTAGTSLGTIELDYEVEFYVPRLGSSTTARSTTIRLPAYVSGTRTPLTPGVSSPVASVLNAFNTLVGETKTQFLNDGIGSAIRNFVPLSNVYPPSDGSILPNQNTTVQGFPLGNYTYSVSMFTNTDPISNATYMTSAWTQGFSTPGIQGCQSALTAFSTGTGLGTCSLPVNSGDVAIDPTGVSWAFGESYSFSFSGAPDSERCAFDVGLALVSNSITVPTDAVFYMTITLAGYDIIYDVNPVTGTLHRLPPCSPRDLIRELHQAATEAKPFAESSLSESKEEKKLRIRTPDEDDDGVDYRSVTPPRFRPAPSLAPGAPSYRAGSQGRSTSSVSSSSSSSVQTPTVLAPSR